jgi:hypothetical protein
MDGASLKVLNISKEELSFAPMNYNALALSPHELPTVLLCPHELPFCTKKPLPSVKAVNSNDQNDNALWFMGAK